MPPSGWFVTPRDFTRADLRKLPRRPQRFASNLHLRLLTTRLQLRTISPVADTCFRACLFPQTRSLLTPATILVRSRIEAAHE